MNMLVIHSLIQKICIKRFIPVLCQSEVNKKLQLLNMIRLFNMLNEIQKDYIQKLYFEFHIEIKRIVQLLESNQWDYEKVRLFLTK